MRLGRLRLRLPGAAVGDHDHRDLRRRARSTPSSPSASSTSRCSRASRARRRARSGRANSSSPRAPPARAGCAITLEHVLPNIAAGADRPGDDPVRASPSWPRPRSPISASARSRRSRSWGRMLNEAQTLIYRRRWLAHLPRPRDRARRARPQPARRRPARPARPAPRADALMALLEIDDLRSRCRRAARSCDGAARCRLRARARRDRWAWSASRGSRQVDDGAGRDGAAARRRAGRPAAIRFDGRDLLGSAEPRDVRDARRPHRHGVPGADDRAQPAADASASRSPSRCACTAA